jgi:osmoprotectant transport system permease protein
VILQHGTMSGKDSVYRYVQEQFDKQFHISWLKPIGFNNAYALMMREDEARDLHVHSISDLAGRLERPGKE